MKNNDAVRNAERLTSVLGEWPPFADAEIVSLSLNREGAAQPHKASAVLKVSVKGHLVTFGFTDISEVELSGFNHQNVIDGLLFSKHGDRTKVVLEHCYGLSGSFQCASANIEGVEA